MPDRRLFVDLDGVMADFAGQYERTFGVAPDRIPGDTDTVTDILFANIRSVPGFFLNLPVLPGAREFWRGVCALHPSPIILTGRPWSVVGIEAQKYEWVRRNLDAEAVVLCCESKDKALHCSRGDVLIDDWLKYRRRWIRAGGVFVHHTSHDRSLVLAKKVLERGRT